jgi:hypothetical protein
MGGLKGRNEVEDGKPLRLTRALPQIAVPRKAKARRHAGGQPDVDEDL